MQWFGPSFKQLEVTIVAVEGGFRVCPVLIGTRNVPLLSVLNMGVKREFWKTLLERNTEDIVPLVGYGPYKVDNLMDLPVLPTRKQAEELGCLILNDYLDEQDRTWPGRGPKLEETDCPLPPAKPKARQRLGRSEKRQIRWCSTCQVVITFHDVSSRDVSSRLGAEERLLAAIFGDHGEEIHNPERGGCGQPVREIE